MANTFNNNNNFVSNNNDDDFEEDLGDAPLELLFDDPVFDFAFHPMADVIAVGSISGQLQVHKYAFEENVLLFDIQQHTDSLRAMGFTTDGTALFTASSDMSIKCIDCNTGTQILRFKSAHESPVNSLLICDQNHMATGDDDGVIKFWDLRIKKCAMTFDKVHTDFISDMCYVPTKNALLAVSADGCISGYDLRKRLDIIDASDTQDDELLSVVPIKNDSKILIGTQSGALMVFDWGQWGAKSTSIPGHPASVQSMVKMNENTVITGSVDGLIRVTKLFSGRVVNVVGDHEDFPIEKIAFSRDPNLLASCSHDQSIKFWNIKHLYESANSNDEDEVESTVKETLKEGDDIDMDDSDDESNANTINVDDNVIDSDSDDAKGKKKKGKQVVRPTGKKEEMKDFFSGL